MSGRVSDTGRQGTTADELSHDRLEHDLRQSLCAMSAMLDVIRHGPLETPEVLRRLELIRRESDWAASVLTAEAGKRQPMDAGEVVEATWRMVAEEAPCPVRLVREPVPATLLDPVRLGRAVRNLLDNAVRAAGADGAVEVRVRARGAGVQIEVADSGPGFGRIPQVHGLGLGTVRQVVAQLGGQLVIGEDRLGGARLTVHLPSVFETQMAVGEAI